MTRFYLPSLLLLLLAFGYQLNAQKVDYDKIIPKEWMMDSLPIQEKLVLVSWKNYPENEKALIELDAAKSNLTSKKDEWRIAVIEAEIKRLKLHTRAEVLKRYQNYMSTVELLKYRNKSQEEAHLVHLVVTKNLKKGEGTIEDYNKSFMVYNEAIESKIQVENALAQTKIELEELLGMNLEEVLAKKSENVKLQKRGDTTILASGLKYISVIKGTGDKPKPGQRVQVYYTGKFLNGREFESNRKDDPFKFTIGVQQAIPGWDEGVLLMREGEKGILVLPPKLAYGRTGIKDPSNDGQYMVPPDTPVMYEIDLVDVK
jgi:FKBP-type peptidyl-prolyl cis-trans isomerase